MNVQPERSHPVHLLIQLEIFTEHADEADLSLVGAVGRETIDELQAAGYAVQPVSTGLRGGELLVEVITTLTTIATNIWSNKETIERVLADAGGLVTVCGGIVPVARTISRIFKKRTANAGIVQEPVKITLEIDGAPVTVEAADLEQAEAALTLAQRFHANHPTIASQVTTQSKVKLRANVPKTPRRKRR